MEDVGISTAQFEMMQEVCLNTAYQIENNEEKIRNRLLEGYLDNDEVRTKIGLDKMSLRFIPEVPESYKSSKDVYMGIVDIKVVTENWLRSSRNDYFTIECKRIDGSAYLNKYVINGFGGLQYINIIVGNIVIGTPLIIPFSKHKARIRLESYR